MNKKLRRKVLRGMAVSVPVAWSAPIVQSVVLPAHAATSFDRFCESDPSGNHGQGGMAPFLLAPGCVAVVYEDDRVCDHTVWDSTCTSRYQDCLIAHECG